MLGATLPEVIMTIVGAPLFTFFGAYFPAWLLCGLLGILAAVLARVIFIAVGIDAVMALRLLTYSSIGILCAVGSWQFLFGP